MSPRLELVWPGKDKFLLVPKDDNTKPVWVEPDHPAAREVRLTDFEAAHGKVDDDDPYRDNVLLTGDSLDVLRVLRDVPEYARHYRGKVKLVYVDPPFNTGQTFTHHDDWLEHATWLSFMRDRLLSSKTCLPPTGRVGPPRRRRSASTTASATPPSSCSAGPPVRRTLAEAHDPLLVRRRLSWLRTFEKKVGVTRVALSWPRIHPIGRPGDGHVSNQR